MRYAMAAARAPRAVAGRPRLRKWCSGRSYAADLRGLRHRRLRQSREVGGRHLPESVALAPYLADEADAAERRQTGADLGARFEPQRRARLPPEELDEVRDPELVPAGLLVL